MSTVTADDKMSEARPLFLEIGGTFNSNSGIEQIPPE